jgi:glutaminyl-tRNA synthetase
MDDSTAPAEKKNFIELAIDQDMAKDSWGDRPVQTRFPPEPNGYLHIGHAKSICLNFGLAKKYGGRCNLRFDDTNPSKENEEYVGSIQEDVNWLGFEWDELHYASDYFEQLYDLAVQLISNGDAYVCDLTPDEMREHRGTPVTKGRNCVYRDRSVDENIQLFADMRAGKFADGTKTLRAKIDMAADNFNMRDPVMYRIMRAHHHRTADAWCIYPMYDWAHGQSDSIEKITHSICTLEFEHHRPLYDWFCKTLQIYHPRQMEFARLNLTYTVMSKRKLLQLVEEKHVSGWNDPRMPTISGLRRRGFTPKSIRNFCDTIGVTRINSMIDVLVLENSVREDLNPTAARYMAVFDPIKVVLTNVPEDSVETLQAINNPENEAAGSRTMQFSRELYIQREDFEEDPPKKFFRLKPGGEVRLRYAYVIQCEEVVKDADGNIVQLNCTVDFDTRSGSDNQPTRKIKGTIHWVDAATCQDCTVRNYDRLFVDENPESAEPGKTFLDNLNPNSLEVVTAKVEPIVMQCQPGERVQFERNGYYCADTVDSVTDKPVFNRIVTLRDSWAKMKSK